jgi:protein O-mannosyl-transferase
MNKKYTYFVIIFLIIVSCIAFGRIADNDFVTYDDTIFITENMNIQSGFNLESIKWALTTTYFSYWHPMTWLSFMLDWTLFKANPAGTHLVSLLLHIGAVIFLFLFLNKTTKSIWPSAFAAALFALHPLRVESVAWAAERKDVLSMFFGMACLYAYAFWAENSKLPRYFLCLILFAMALMSKPMMVTLPFVLMLLDYWPLKRWQEALPSAAQPVILKTTKAETKKSKKQKTGSDKGIKISTPVNTRGISIGSLIAEKVPFLLLTVITSYITVWAQKKEGATFFGEEISFVTRVSNAIVSYIVYLVKTFWPINLAVYYPYDLSLPLWKVLISAIILLVITAAVFYYIKKMPFLFVGWFVFLGTLIPVIGIVQVGTQSMGDRYTYLPSVGIIVMLVWGISSLIKDEEKSKNILFPMGIVILIILTVLTWRQCGYWKDTFELFNHAALVTQNNHFAHNKRGALYAKRGQYPQAIEDFSTAISIRPDYTYAYNNRGNAYEKLSQYQRAVEDYSKAISISPDYEESYLNRAAAFGKLGQHELASEDYRQAIRLNPDLAQKLTNRGNNFNYHGQYQQAIEEYNKAIIMNPDHAMAYLNRGIAYLMIGNKIQGCSDAQKACQLGACKLLEMAQGRGDCR